MNNAAMPKRNQNWYTVCFQVLPNIPVLLLSGALALSCSSVQKPQDTSTVNSGFEQGTISPEELRRLVELGSPSAFLALSGLITTGDVLSFRQNKALLIVSSAIAAVVYPDLDFPAINNSDNTAGGEPENSSYIAIINEAAQGNYTVPSGSSRDFLELVLPFLSCYTESSFVNINAERLRTAITYLDRAARLNGDSVLPHLFRGFAYEKTADFNQAAAAYRKALELDSGCYPAELGLARLSQAQGRLDEALAQLNKLESRYPNYQSIGKQQARLFVAQRNWQRANAIISSVLARNNRDREFLLLRTEMLLEQGNFQQAQQPLDTFAALDSANSQYIFLRARLQAEGLRNREGAIALLRPLARSLPNESKIAIYFASLLMESGRREDIEEGREILNRFLGGAAGSGSSAGAGVAPEALSLAAADSVNRENWREAKGYLDRLLPRRRNDPDLLNAWKTERALGNNAAALSYARELYNKDNPADEAVSAYVISLIDTGRQTEAARIIDQRLASAPSGARKSHYYYLRSRVRSDEDAVLNDLRSALFEDPKNIDALIAMFEIYHRKRDERRAVYYLRQALTAAPNNPVLKRYEQEYRTLLGNY